jgi:hypothetical protein
MKRKASDLYRKQRGLQIDFESAKLRLALLKENFGFQEFYKSLKKDPKKVMPAIADHLEKFGLNRNFISWSFPLEQILTLFDPEKDFDPSNFSKAEVPGAGINWQKYFGEGLPNLFFRPTITQVVFPDHRFEHFNCCFIMPEKLKPFERALLIDARARKEDIVREFEIFIDRVRHKHETYEKDERYSYREWEPMNSRERKEAWRNLEIWKRRWKFNSFPAIAKDLKISEDDAKKNFYNIFELIHGERYTKKIWQKSRNKKLRGGKPFVFCKTCKEYCLGPEYCPQALEKNFREISLESLDKTAF